MNYKYQYNDLDERQYILKSNADKILIEEQNTTDGNFLIFSDEPQPTPAVYITMPESELQNMKDNIALLQTALDDVILNSGGGF